MPDISIIKSTCSIRIGSPGENRPAVAEDGQFHLVIGLPEHGIKNTSEPPGIDLESAMGLQSRAQSVKIESIRPRCGDDLHRTTTAKNRGGAGRCLEVIESTEPAAGTGGLSRGPNVDASLTLVPEIPGDEGGVHR